MHTRVPSPSSSTQDSDKYKHSFLHHPWKPLYILPPPLTANLVSNSQHVNEHSKAALPACFISFLARLPFLAMVDSEKGN